MQETGRRQKKKQTSSDASNIQQKQVFYPKRSLGQNFVFDQNTLKKICRLANVSSGDNVLEVGPGFGTLTRELLKYGATVTAIEIDGRLVGELRFMAESEGNGHLRIIEGNALTVPMNTIFNDVSAVTTSASATPNSPDLLGAPFPTPLTNPLQPSGTPNAPKASGTPNPGATKAAPLTRWKMVSNLPYNIATPVVMRVLEEAEQVDSIVVMVQREVALRWTAKPGSSLYGAVPVKMSYFSDVKLAGSVSRNIFFPRPNVESSIVIFSRLPQVPVATDYKSMVKLIGLAYRHRRKMLRNSLAPLCDEHALGQAGIPPTSRPQQLSIEDWGRLALAASSGNKMTLGTPINSVTLSHQSGAPSGWREPMVICGTDHLQGQRLGQRLQGQGIDDWCQSTSDSQ